MENSAQSARLPHLHESELFHAIKNPAFRRIGLMGRAGKRSVIQSLIQIAQTVNDMKLTLIMDVQTANLPTLDLTEIEKVKIVKRGLIGEICDLVIVVGGDGSILHAAEALARYRVPVLGVNRGRLGFLADVKPDEAAFKLRQVLMGDYQLDHRFLLTMEIREGRKIIHEDMALNDIVLHAGKSVHMIDFQMKIDGHDVYRQHSDGLIAATPTGSTAYALSGGGPIIHPSMDAICLVPMHPHTLSSRPIVVSGNSEVCIRIHEDNRTQPMVSADGKPSVPLEQEQRLHIRKHPDKLTLLHPPGFDFYEACRTKLHWNVHAEEFSLDVDDDIMDDE
ncbi:MULTISPECIES: NAD(+) kinase [unclassified Psychrobacter]|uniref:NAD(+) kinase n=1 Tax=unclassified Psychrobacter TaxID=196806 RepID=UPI0025B38681|nr:MULTISPECIES: NAD(+) kinase [unclassified Psychrobacter]MDN3453689.1 NAD(+) kinase [Psychrobacter sp. APC 3350]MDN3501129.1 NAD(+) kinase [Psychrobacter sp. 5A.1]